MIKAMVFCYLQGNLVINMVKKVMDTGTKTVTYAVKTASKRLIQETAKATGDLIGNNVADKISLVGKRKSKKKEDERQEHMKESNICCKDCL